MVELRQFDLQFTFRALGAQGKNVEDQARAVNDAALQQAFEVALLRGRQIVIENDEIRLVRCDLGADFLHLAFASECRGIRAMALALHLRADIRTGRFGQQTNFFQPVGKIARTKIELNDDRTLTARRRTLKHQCATSDRQANERNGR